MAAPLSQSQPEAADPAMLLETLTAALPFTFCYEGLGDDKKAVCSLIMSCKALYNSVASVWCGQMRLDYSCSSWAVDRTVKSHATLFSFSKWLARHGKVLKQLTLHLPGDTEDCYRLGDAIAAGLAAAAASAPGLLLQQVEVYRPTASILQQLPANTLTRLDLQCCHYSSSTDYLSYAAAALACLTNLKHLFCQCNQSSYLNEADADMGDSQPNARRTNVDALFPAISQLRKLTRLTLQPVCNPSLLSELPDQLVELHVIFIMPNQSASQAVQLQVSHLTALTKLKHNVQTHDIVSHSVHSSSLSGVTVGLETQLPLSLKELWVTDVLDVQPLLQLKQLELLNIAVPTLDAEALKQLGAALSKHSNCSDDKTDGSTSDAIVSAGGSLQCVQLSYWGGMDVADAAAAGWSAIPLESLVIGGSSYTARPAVHADTVQIMSSLSCLTQLELLVAEMQHSLHLLPGVLKQLPELQTFRLKADDLSDLSPDDDDVDALAEAMYEVARAVAGLKHLQELQLCHPCDDAAALQLSSLTQLTGLSLEGCCDITDFPIVAIAYSVTGLKWLDLAGCDCIGNASLVVVGHQLKHLEVLILSGTSVSDEGVAYLFPLAALMDLFADGTFVTDEAMAFF